MDVVAKVARPSHLYSKASVQLPVAERKWFFRLTAVRAHTCYSDAAISNATIGRPRIAR